jgi:hypothetical protein
MQPLRTGLCILAAGTREDLRMASSSAAAIPEIARSPPAGFIRRREAGRARRLP